MKVNATFKEQNVEIDMTEDDTSIDFNGVYLVEISHNNGALETTGIAIDGWGIPLTFDANEFSYTIKK